MKQFTTPEQTAKLIELGLPKPKSEVKAEQAWEYAWYNPAYSIGELIEMLPPHIDQIPLDIGRLHLKERWVLCYNPQTQIAFANELIDGLFRLIVQLKEKKKI